MRHSLELNLAPQFRHAKWWGRGPGEAYADTKMAQRFGNWEAGEEELWTGYEWPQEGGGRTDVRWVEFSSGGGDDEEGEDEKGDTLKASFGDKDGCGFTANCFTTADLEECTHDYELQKRKKDAWIVRLDWRQHGIGSGSCGPTPAEQYKLRAEDFEFEIILE
ncbi:hypothetical protein V494_08244 [Pseudogymnoascus sp. VKM F-4513 (FW-928)]|nr:hypothetical protein V494_08244 [Pseudogymnoascus sp. VKM F-4513 (FW-928)]